MILGVVLGTVLTVGVTLYLFRSKATEDLDSVGKKRWSVPRAIAGVDHIEINSAIDSAVRRDMIRLTVPYSSVQRYEGKRPGTFADSCLVLLYPDSRGLLTTAEFSYRASPVAGKDAFVALVDSLRSTYRRPFTLAEEKVTELYSSFSARESFKDSGSIVLNIEVHRDNPARSSMSVVFSNLVAPKY